MFGMRYDDPDTGSAVLAFANLGDEPMNILLIGSDKSTIPGDPGRSDTQMLVRLELDGPIKSLNVSNAAAVALYAIVKSPRYTAFTDFVEFQKNHEAGMTPSTPVIPLIYALQSKLEDIAAEGLANRYARHARLNARVRAWGEAKGYTLFPPAGFGVGWSEMWPGLVSLAGATALLGIFALRGMRRLTP